MKVVTRIDLLNAVEKEPLLTDFGFGIWHGHEGDQECQFYTDRAVLKCVPV